jgi:hypothetical protein
METFLSGDLDQVPMRDNVSPRSHNPLEVSDGCFPRGFCDPDLEDPTRTKFERHSLVGANTGGLKGLGAQLLILVGNQVDAQGELVDVRTLPAKVEDTDLGVRYTTVEPRLGVRLKQQDVSN